MATKTVITANVPQTRGISIVIDQDQAQQLQQQRDREWERQQDAAKITIFQSTNTYASQTRLAEAAAATQTATTTMTSTLVRAEPAMALLQQVSPKHTAATTFIDINRNNTVDQANVAAAAHVVVITADSNVVAAVGKQALAKETGYSAATTLPQLLLKVANTHSGSAADTATTTTTTMVNNSNNNNSLTMLANASERGKLNEELNLAVGKWPNSPHVAAREQRGGISITHGHGECVRQSNGVAVAVSVGADNDEVVPANKIQIIQCNGKHELPNGNNTHTHAQQSTNTNTHAEVATELPADVQRRSGVSVEEEESLRRVGSTGRFVGVERTLVAVAAVSVAAGENGQLSCAGVHEDNEEDVAAVFGQERPALELQNICAALVASSLTTPADCASALTETVEPNAQCDTHVVKIQIKPVQVRAAQRTEQQQQQEQQEQQEQPAVTAEHEKQVSVITLNDESVDSVGDAASQSPNLPLLQLSQVVNMVQKPVGGASAAAAQSAGGNISSGSTTVTELNVNNSPYLYYMMSSSGQFSPCDTLDSGTGSDLESNGHHATHNGAASPKVTNGSSSGSVGSVGGGAPKLEMHLQTTKIRVHNPSKCADKQCRSSSGGGGDHQRAGSLTDSEESESSSLSCDSLHSAEYMRQCSVSPTDKQNSVAANAKILSSLLPDSLLRDIRDRKFPTNDFESKYGDAAAQLTHTSLNEKDYPQQVQQLQQAVAHAKFVQAHNNNNSNSSSAPSAGGKRASLPSKTFVLNTADGTFVDTKMNSMPRKYEADKYYDFHVNEHENFRSFGSGGSVNGSLGSDSAADTASLAEYDMRSLHDDAFAGYKDIRCGSATSTIRSSKGTVRGVKNRVRNGIATFLQLQQPHVKNYMEKDLGKVVLYTTSMGIIRDTYAKCANVKQILRTLLVKFEERDVFMSVEYQAEIKDRMHSEAIKVPQLFVEGQHIGDAETVERLNESGELRQLLKPYKSIASTYTCQTCGGYRLLPCPSCNGSKKSVHRNHFTAEFVALKCMNCDEVGLVKCHNC